ncbi:MAG: hypothetical protein V1897_03205 [Pseudomonadota bacterium]
MKYRFMHLNLFDSCGVGKTICVIALSLLLANLVFTDLAQTAEPASPKISGGDTLKKKEPATEEIQPGQLSWEMPGRLSIYDLQFGPAIAQSQGWKFLGNSRTFNAGLFGDRLILMVRFYYKASASDTPLKFVIKLPDSRQYEETIRLSNNQGQFAYHFTIHRPEDFLGSGMIYVYYGFSIVDVLDFAIMPGA